MARIGLALGIVVTVSSNLGCGHPPGRRLLHGGITVDGKPVLKSMFDVADHLTPAQAWMKMEGRMWTPEGKFAGRGPRVVLQGKIVLTLDHAGTSFAAVTLKTLTLVSAPGVPGKWVLAAGEAKRTRAGIGK